MLAGAVSSTIGGLPVFRSVQLRIRSDQQRSADAYAEDSEHIMRTEAKKSFRSGFMLTESEIRRIVADILEQLGNDGAKPDHPQFELKFRNGSIAYPSSLEEILKEENHGSALITRLKINAQTIDKGENDEPLRSVTVEFINRTAEEDDIGVKYTIIGDHRDWVFVTSSRIEERILKIKRFTFSQYYKELLLIAFALGLLVFAFSIMLTILTSFPSAYDNKLNLITELEESWKSGEFKDSTEAVLMGIRILVERPQVPDNIDMLDIVYPWPIGIAMFFVIAIIPIAGINFFFPRYNFYWGDYIGFYDRRAGHGRVIYVAVGLAFVVGVAASYMANVLAAP